MSQVKVSSIVDTSGGNTVTINGYTPTLSNMAGRNRIINGDMRIDQRNAGASVTPTDGQFVVDRFFMGVSQTSKLTAQRSTVAPAGFTNSVLVTSSSAYSVLAGDYFAVSQNIEGFNVADLGWGAAGAQTVTLSFWVRSSLTGTFSGSLRNSANNRSYPFTYSISSANTWEQKTVTISGDTSGTWLTDNGAGIRVWFALGTGSTFSGTAGSWSGSNLVSATGATSVVGTNGATFYITGVQLEAGSVATPFERRPYGTELALCQRYYAKLGSVSGGSGAYPAIASGYIVDSTTVNAFVKYPVAMRANPTATYSTLYVQWSGTQPQVTSIDATYPGTDSAMVNFRATGGLTTGQACNIAVNNSTTGGLSLSSEL